jgi:hypothetical protein
LAIVNFYYNNSTPLGFRKIAEIISITEIAVQDNNLKTAFRHFIPKLFYTNLMHEIKLRASTFK